jgi:1-hydroxycarotenoid 3,4-desaturase
MRGPLKVVVIGAGVGGLACAIDLAASGEQVLVFERGRGAGGKARLVRVEDTEIDAGPTVLTMPWVFDELFELAGGSFRTEVGLQRATILARHAWSDGKRLDLHAERERSAEAIGEVFGGSQARAYLAFCEDGRRIFELAEGPFLRAQRPTMTSIAKQFGSAGLAALARLDSHRSMWRALEQRFTSPQLRQLFGRYATYCGSSPFEAPATLNLVAHVESEGVFRAREGMFGIVSALERLARAQGVDIRYEQGVDRVVIDRERATGVIVGEAFHAADVVVFNGDASALGASLLGAAAARAAPPTPADHRSLSAVTWATRARARGFPLLHHNVFFSDDYRKEFDSILRRGESPSEPTVYVCAQDRGDLDDPRSEERLLLLINAPANGDLAEHWTERERERCTNATIGCFRGRAAPSMDHDPGGRCRCCRVWERRRRCLASISRGEACTRGRAYRWPR